MNAKQTTNIRISDYHSLLPVQKIMVRIMAVNIDYCRLGKLIDCLNDLGFRTDPGKEFTTVNIQPFQKELIDKGLLLKSTRGVCCPESIRQQALHETILEDKFAQIAEVVQNNISLSSGFENYQQVLRNFQIALFAHDNMDPINSIVNYYRGSYFRDTSREKDLFLNTLNNPFSPKIIKKIDPKIRLEVLCYLLRRAEEALAPAHDIIVNLTKTYGSEINGTYHSMVVVFHYLICGDTATAALLLDDFADDMKPEQLGRMGWLELIKGNYEQAIKLFSQAIKLIKKLTRKQKISLRSYTGLFHLLTLLQTGESARLKEGLEYINIAEKDKYPLSPLMEMLRPVFCDQLGLPVTECDLSTFSGFDDEPLDIFIVSLAQAWSNKSKASTKIPQLNELRDKAQKNGYTWLAAELSALLAFLGYLKKENNALAAKLHKSCNTTSFVDIIREQPKWEKTLNALLSITDNSKKIKNNNPAQRLIWLFGHNEKYSYCHITPRMQKTNKNGSWSKGRPVALKNLYSNHLTMEGLTEQDRRVCRAIKAEYYRTSWRYGKTEYEIDDDIALPALVGHPFLFLEDSPNVRVELILSEPEMQLKKENGKLKLSIFPDTTDSTDKVQVVKDTPTRFKVIRFSKEHNQIIEFLGKELTIPESGEKLVKQVIDSLSSVVRINSDLATGQRAENIEADSRPHAHILPRQDGICLEFLVKPCGTGGSSFRPGKGGKCVLTEIKGKKIQATRDFAKEKKQQNHIIQSCPTLNHLQEVENQYQVDDPENSLELLLELKECGNDVVLEWPQGEKMAVRKEVSFNSFSMQIKKDRDWFQATGSLEIDDSLALDLRKLLDMLSRATGRFIPLDDGTFLAITNQLRKRLDELSAFSEGHGKGVRFAPLAALALEDLTDEAGQLKCDKAWKQHCKQLNEVVKPQVPSTLHASLRDYQVTGFNWLAQLCHWGVGGCLADDMGLGKTVQALAAILLRSAQGPTLVIAPLSVTSNWQEEARRFAPTLNVIVFGPGDRQQVIDNLQPFDLLIVSYGLLPIEAELLGGVMWQTVVLDEAQAIKNMQTKRSKAAMALQAEFRIITTGTPVENHLGELWTLFNFLNPGLLGSFKKFNEKFAVPIERDQDNEARNRLRKLIRPFILRRLKSDVLQELPPKTEITLDVEMSTEELLLYEAQRLKALENISSHNDEGTGQQHLRILGEIMKLRRLCCNPNLILPDSKIKSSKLKVFGDTLTELLNNNHKALVFSQFVGHLKIIRDYLDTKNISYQYLDGSTPIKKRKQRISNFQNGDGDVFLISLKAGGSGLNLTAADYVIHMDPWWNPAVEDQASDRAHRIGQDRPVTVYRLVIKNSIEEQIVDMHKQKRDLADSLLEGTDSAGKISAKELLGLLQEK